MDHAKQPHTNPIAICRPAKTSWVLLILIGVLGSAQMAAVWLMAPVQGHSQPDHTLASITAALFLAFTIRLYWMMRARIEATDHGLRWRGLHGWKSCAWREVIDYYLLDAQEQKTYLIETPQGKISISPFLAGGEAMARAVASRAVNARVRQWEMLGFRAGDVPPCRFRYYALEIWVMIAFFTIGGLTLAFLSVPSHPIAAFNETRQSIGLSWAVASGVLGVFEGLGIGLMIVIYASFLFTSWTALKNANQIIETNATGIMFTDGARRIEARWDQVIQQYGPPQNIFKMMLSHSYSIRTEAGNFSVYPFLRNEVLLQRIIRHWVPPNANTRKTNAQMDVLGGEASLWSGGVPGIGLRVYHYRTRTNRVYLGALTFFAVLMLFFPWLLQWAGTAQNTSDATFVSIDALFVVSTLWSWWRYLTARIEIDDAGILERSVFGPRRLEWTEITSITNDGAVVTLHGSDTKVRYWVNVADFLGFSSEIERHTSLTVPGKAEHKV